MECLRRMWGSCPERRATIMISYNDLTLCGVHPGLHSQQRAELALQPRILCLLSSGFSCKTVLTHQHLLFGNIRIWQTSLRISSKAILPIEKNLQYDKNAVSYPYLSIGINRYNQRSDLLAFQSSECDSACPHVCSQTEQHVISITLLICCHVFASGHVAQMNRIWWFSA